MDLRNKGSRSPEEEPENLTTIPTPIQSLDKKNGYVILDGHPCKIHKTGVVRSGFRSTKTWIAGLNIFTNKEYTQSFPSYGHVEVPVIKRTEYALCGIEENGFVSLMDGEANMREDLRLPSSQEKGDLTEKIINAFEANQNVVVTVLEACGRAMIVDLKEDTSS